MQTKIKYILLPLLIGVIFCKKESDQNRFLDNYLLYYLLTDNTGKTIIFERNDYNNTVRNFNFARLPNISGISEYGDGISDGYEDNFITPRNVYFVIAGVALWKSPENGGIAYGEESWQNADLKIKFFENGSFARSLNLSGSRDRSFLANTIKNIDSSFNRIGFMPLYLDYDFKIEDVHDPRLKHIEIYLLHYFAFDIIGNNFDLIGFDSILARETGMVYPVINIKNEPQCDDIFQILTWGPYNMIRECIIPYPYQEYQEYYAFYHDVIALNNSLPFLRLEFNTFEIVPLDNGNYFVPSRLLLSCSKNPRKACGDEYIDDLLKIKLPTTLTGNELSRDEFLRRGVVVFKIPEEDQSKLDNPNATIIFDVDASNIFFWDSNIQRNGFDFTIDRPDPSIGKDLKIYLPKISVRVE
jgi:hypothetical protein